jgi:hypothetical protein
MIENTYKIWDTEEIRAIKASAPIAEEGAFTADDMAAIHRLLTACYMVLKPPGDQEPPGQIKAQLTGLKNGFGGWLDSVGRAILRADLPIEDRMMVNGAYSMACAFLFDIEGCTKGDLEVPHEGGGQSRPAAGSSRQSGKREIGSPPIPVRALYCHSPAHLLSASSSVTGSPHR